ncbi:hypothetical protein CONPUDRAFT_30544, partial [Coniophora puteana RWD-64-598 SS2]
FDQTQVVMANTSTTMFEIKGSKQVAVVGKEEKCAFTTVVGVSASGELLPTQFIFKGQTARALSSLMAPGQAEAFCLGFIYSLNKENYWSNFDTMEEYF